MDLSCNTKKLLGSGAYGSVYETDQDGFACKMYEQDEDRGLDASLLTELSVSSCLKDNPYVIHMVDLKIEDNQSIVYMSRYSSDLKHALVKLGDHFDFDLKKHILYQIIQGLYGAHQKAIIHRDLALDNILFNATGDVVIADWGSSLFFNENNKHPLQTELVRLDYRSPELFMGDVHYDSSVDMWSVGIMVGLLFSRDNHLIHDRSQFNKFIKVCHGHSHDHASGDAEADADVDDDNDVGAGVGVGVGVVADEFVNMYHDVEIDDHDTIDMFVNFDQDHTGLDLLHRLLNVKPHLRITATEALNHPFFSIYCGCCHGGKQQQEFLPFSSQETLTFYQEIPINPNWNTDQISEKMRLILIDWMIEVCLMLRLSFEILFLGIEYLDYYVSQTTILRSQLQLLGLSCVLMASKIILEKYPPEISNYVTLCSDAYTKAEINKFEQKLILIVKDRLYVPTPLTHLNVLTIDEPQYSLAIYRLCLMIRHLSSRQYTSTTLSLMAQSDRMTQTFLETIPAHSQKNTEALSKILKHLKIKQVMNVINNDTH